MRTREYSSEGTGLQGSFPCGGAFVVSLAQGLADRPPDRSAGPIYVRRGSEGGRYDVQP